MRESAISKISQMLKDGKRLSVQTALLLANTTELRSAISKLKKRGWKIEDEWKTNTKGHKYKEYFLVDSSTIG